MRLHQLNIQYRPEADRLLLRITTSTGDALAFELTRRYVALLWPVLQDLLRHEFGKRAPEATQKPEIAEAMVAFEREKVVSGGDFSRPFAVPENASFPLGKAPVLLGRIQVKRKEVGNPILCLLPAGGAGIEFPADHRLLHFLSSLLKQGVDKAGWGLDLSAETPTASHVGKPTLH